MFSAFVEVGGVMLGGGLSRDDQEMIRCMEHQFEMKINFFSEQLVRLQEEIRHLRKENCILVRVNHECEEKYMKILNETALVIESLKNEKEEINIQHKIELKKLEDNLTTHFIAQLSKHIKENSAADEEDEDDKFNSEVSSYCVIL